MKHAIIFLNLLFMGFGVARAQVTLTATSGTGSGTFTTLKEAFDAINAGTHQGTIVININESTSESASAVLNASGTGSASYSSVAITPSGARTITGAITGHLIDLDGADNVTIDGLNSGGNSLSIINTATGASSTVRFINDASNNTVQNATIQGSTTSFGVVFFSTGTTTGNDGNNINNCTITAAGANFPINGIYSLGTSALIDNSGNTINANSISDFFSAGSATFGINVNSFNSTWTVSNNKLFQTGTRTYTTDNTHNAIAVSHGDGYAITGNTIGYASAAGTGVYTMTIPEGVTVPVRPRFIGINLAVGTTTASSVQGNTITAINLSTASAENSANGILCGINITAGNVNVGNLTANTIGASSGVDALSATKTTPSGAVVGINSSSTGIIVIQNNEIGGLTSTGITATASGNIIGINVTGVATSINISTNIIGNATANNMRGGTLGITTNGSGAAGINLASTPTSATINNNTIRNLSSYGTAVGGYVRGIMTTTTTSETATGWTINNNTISNLTTNNTSQFATNGVISAVGIHHASSLGCTISQNTISNISNINSTSTFNIIVAGISLGASARITTLVTSITGNKIFGLSNLGVATSASRPPTLAGILVSAGNNINLIANNLISLGNGQSTNTTIIGIWSHNSSTNPSSTNVYHNSVNIEGTVTSGAHSSFGFQRGDLSTTATVSSRTVVVDLRNNIFNNTRSGGTGGHYAISNNFGATAVSATGWGVNASNFNVLNAASGTIGYWSSAQTFSGWKTASASDNNSISAVSVPFTNTATGDLHLNYGTTPTQLESGGTTLAAITTDFDNDARPGPTGTVNGGALFSDIGADEFDGVMVFNSLTWNGSVSNDWSNASNWTPAILPDNRSTGIIPTGLSNYPVLTTNVSMNELTLSSSSTLNLSSNNLTLSGNLINNGSITGTGILELNGAKAQQISGTGTVNNIKINNTSGGVSIASGSNKLNVTGLYTPTNGVLTTNGNLVFRSTATQEGVVGTAGICPTEPISGDVTVEKYIPAKRAFRFLTPGVTTSTTINANWQEGSSVNSTVGYPYVGGTTENPTSGYGTHIMGTGGATNGFDLSISNSPSLFTFNVSSYAWVAEANTNVAGNVLNRGEAYRLFVRGDRGVNLNTDAEAATATTIRTTGVLKICESMSFSTTSPIVPLSGVAGRYSFIGNPYWSVVDWHAVTKSNVEENLYYWDPTISGTNGRGGYVTYNQTAASNNTAGSLADRYIQPGQAFFVRNNPDVDGSILPTVTFDATDIVGTAPTRTAIFSRNDIKAGEEAGMLSQERMQAATTSAIEKIYVSLLIKSKPGTGPADGFLVAYNKDFKDSYGREDAAKFSNLDENITAVYNGSRQSILGLQTAISNEVKSDTIPISLTNLYDGEYVVKVSIDKGVNPAREVYVLNRMTGQQIKVDHANGLELSFLNALGVKTKEDLVLVVNSRSSEPELPAVKKLLLYPNPVTGGVVSLRVPMGELKPAQLNGFAKVEIRNTNKRVVFRQQVQLDNQGRVTLNIGTLSGGMYVVKVSIGDKSFTTKMVKL